MLKITKKVEKNIEEYLSFLNNFDSRTNYYTKEFYQYFSHRLHWDEHPFCYKLRENFSEITEKSIEDILNCCLVFSFLNEHYITFEGFLKEGNNYILKNTNLSRYDLFEIYLPLGMTKQQSLITCQDISKPIAKRILNRFKVRKYTIMELTRILDEAYKKKGFVKWGYCAKNAARYFAMAFPEIIDPESPVVGGSGHFEGLSYIFDCPEISSGIKIEARLENGNLIPERDFLVGMWFSMMGYLNAKTQYIFRRQNWLNNEDKVCFFNKLIEFESGFRKTPKIKTKYEVIFGFNFIL